MDNGALVGYMILMHTGTSDQNTRGLTNFLSTVDNLLLEYCGHGNLMLAST